jgi:nucleotide-binding universal stress UspA family protein
MLKDVVVYLSVGSGGDAAVRYAVSIGETFEARVAGTAFAFDPVLPTAMMGGISADLIETQRAENERTARALAASFDKAANAAGISAETRVLSGTLAGAAETFAQLARRFDISVVAQADPDKLGAEDLIAEAALFNSGRPVIIVPYIQRGGITLERALVCWDGGRTAARAIGDAMVFLERAKAVEVLIVADDPPKSDEAPGADIGEHLARHNIKVEVRRIQRGDIDVASAILSYVADNGADFIVMGGYGHSRLREFILGGVTRSMLQSMTVPVLMSH